MPSRSRAAPWLVRGALPFALSLAVVACRPGTQVTPIVTNVGRSSGTFVKTSGLDLNSGCQPSTPPAPDYLAWWNALPPANRNYPFAGFEVWRNASTNCTQSRLDVYHALVTFNMAGQSALRGLVQKAELVVSTRAMPESAGRIVTIGPLGSTTAVNADCAPLLGGGGAVLRFGPAAMATLPTLSAAGSLTVLAPGDPFHAGDTLYVFPTRLNATGPVPGANAPTTMSPSGQGGSVFVTDVTGSATSAINGGFPSLSYAITSRFEGPLPAPVPAGHNIDCKTSYDVQLRITHY